MTVLYFVIESVAGKQNTTQEYRHTISINIINMLKEVSQFSSYFMCSTEIFFAVTLKSAS